MDVYDAWNRLVGAYADDSQNPGEPDDLLAEYGYDGTKRRIEKTLTEGGGGSTHVHYLAAIVSSVGTVLAGSLEDQHKRCLARFRTT